MKYFKTEASRTAKRYIITKESFSEHTEHKFPFEQRNASSKFTQYGICPSCLNPIQLIGLSHEIKVSPHGKHTGSSIKGIGEWNQRTYEYCPFAARTHYIAPNEHDLLPDIDSSMVDLYDLLKTQFDRAVYVIKKDFHICCSSKIWKKALNSFVANRIYCYPWLSESNLPYILALRGLHLQNCIGQFFEKDSNIYNALSKHPAVEWQGSETYKYQKLWHKKGMYLNLIYRLTNHKQKAIEGKTLIESLDFCIDNKETGETVYQEKIEFDETFFMNLICANGGKRDTELLKIANEEMPPLQPTI